MRGSGTGNGQDKAYSIEEEASTLHMKHRVEEPDEIAGVFHLLSLDGASAINGTTVMAEDGFCSFKGVW